MCTSIKICFCFLVLILFTVSCSPYFAFKSKTVPDFHRLGFAVLDAADSLNKVYRGIDLIYKTELRKVFSDFNVNPPTPIDKSFNFDFPSKFQASKACEANNVNGLILCKIKVREIYQATAHKLLPLDGARMEVKILDKDGSLLLHTENTVTAHHLSVDRAISQAIRDLYKKVFDSYVVPEGHTIR